MKQTILATAFALSLVAGTAFAHPMHATAESDQAWQGGPGMMMGKGAGMRGPSGQVRGMMGMHGTGMGMMGNKGQCMMGGPHGMMDPAQVEKRDAFFDATKELRKNLHDKKFAYMESTRNPAETIGSLREKEKELATLKQELLTKREDFFTKK